MNKRVFKAFVCAGFYNVGKAYGFATKSERDEFVGCIEGARSYGFVDLAPRQFRKWQESGYWSPYIRDDIGVYIPDGHLNRPGIDNWTPFKRRDGKPETRWGYTPDPDESYE